MTFNPISPSGLENTTNMIPKAPMRLVPAVCNIGYVPTPEEEAAQQREYNEVMRKTKTAQIAKILVVLGCILLAAGLAFRPLGTSLGLSAWTITKIKSGLSILAFLTFTVAAGYPQVIHHNP